VAWKDLAYLDRLEEAGLVTRESCRSDRRLTYARLTTPGIEALRRSRAACATVVEEHFARHPSGQDQRCVREALAKVLRAAGYPGEDPAPTASRTTAPRPCWQRTANRARMPGDRSSDL
jgi:hypothetical protein